MCTINLNPFHFIVAEYFFHKLNHFYCAIDHRRFCQSEIIEINFVVFCDSAECSTPDLTNDKADTVQLYVMSFMSVMCMAMTTTSGGTNRKWKNVCAVN